MARILAVDDEIVVLYTIRRVLLDAGFSVDTATDGERALAMAREGCYDLIVLDVRLPSIDGLAVCQILRRESRVPILMLTGPEDDDAKVEGLDAGADDCLTKPFNSREFVARVRALLRRSMPNMEPGTLPQAGHLRVGGLEIDLVYRRATHLGKPLRLSPKEFDLLVFLANRPGRVFTQSELLEEVWRFDNPSDTRTVSVHIWGLRQKLEADPSRPALIETVRGKGYRLAVEGSRTS